MKVNERLLRIEKALTPSAEDMRQREMAAALRELFPEDTSDMTKEEVDAHIKESLQRIGELKR